MADQPSVKPPYIPAPWSVHGLKVVLPDGSPGVIHETRIDRQAVHPEAFLATIRVDTRSCSVSGFLSVDNRVLREPTAMAFLEQALVDYCARASFRDGFLIHAQAAGNTRGIVFVELMSPKQIC